MYIFDEIRCYCTRCEHEWSVINGDGIDNALQYNQRKQCPICGSRMVKEIDCSTYVGDANGNYVRDIRPEDCDRIKRRNKNKDKTKSKDMVKKTSHNVTNILINIFNYILIVVSIFEAVVFISSLIGGMNQINDEETYTEVNNTVQAEINMNISNDYVEDISDKPIIVEPEKPEKSDMEILAEKIDAEIKADTAHRHAVGTEVEIHNDGAYIIYWVYEDIASFLKELERDEGEVIRDPLDGYIVIKRAEVTSTYSNQYTELFALGDASVKIYGIWVGVRGNGYDNTKINGTNHIKNGDIVYIKGRISFNYITTYYSDYFYTITSGDITLLDRPKEPTLDEMIENEIANDIIHSNAVGTEVEKYEDGTYRIYWVYENVDDFIIEEDLHDLERGDDMGYVIIKRANVVGTYDEYAEPRTMISFGDKFGVIVDTKYMKDVANVGDVFYIKGHMIYSRFQVDLISSEAFKLKTSDKFTIEHIE